MPDPDEAKVKAIVDNVVRHLKKRGIEARTECWDDGNTTCNIHFAMDDATYKLQIMDPSKGFMPMAWRIVAAEEITLGTSENRSPTTADRAITAMCHEIGRGVFSQPGEASKSMPESGRNDTPVSATQLPKTAVGAKLAHDAALREAGLVGLLKDWDFDDVVGMHMKNSVSLLTGKSASTGRREAEQALLRIAKTHGIKVRRKKPWWQLWS